MFLVWFAILFPTYHSVWGTYDISLDIPPPDQHFGLAVVAAACQVGATVGGHRNAAVYTLLDGCPVLLRPIPSPSLFGLAYLVSSPLCPRPSHPTPPHPHITNVQLNIGLAAFNLLLPAYPLDGGRIFADLLLLRGVVPTTAAKITASLATVLGAGVVALGVWRTIVSSTAGVLTIFVGASPASAAAPAAAWGLRCGVPAV